MYLEDIFSLKGKTALVTGGSQGIGQGIALALSKAGADIVIFSRRGAPDTKGLIESQGKRCLDIKCDVTDELSVEAAMDEIIAELGHLDIVFNNAGICIHKGMFEATIEEFRRVMDINLNGEYIVARAAAKKMIQGGIRGSIINMASMSGSIVNVPQCQASYNASKAAVCHLSRSMAVELAPYGIRVNSLCPGYVNTPMSSDVPDELKNAWLPRVPLGHRMAELSELVPAVLYLACDAAGYTTGSDVLIDGGYSAI